jgi:hypothetical protein
MNGALLLFANNHFGSVGFASVHLFAFYFRSNPYETASLILSFAAFCEKNKLPAT